MIPQNKIVESIKGLKAYQEIKHTHENNPTPLQTKQCQRCHFDIAESSLEDYIKNHDGKEQTKMTTPSGQTLTKDFKKLQIIRGSLDDCIGWVSEWS